MRDGRAVLAIVRRDGGGIIGQLEYETGHPSEGWLTVRAIEMSPALRGRGYGSEAVRVLEDEAVKSGGATSFRAAIDRRDGLGLFFWLRLGYRPSVSGEMSDDCFWMVREQA